MEASIIWASRIPLGRYRTEPSHSGKIRKSIGKRGTRNC